MDTGQAVAIILAVIAAAPGLLALSVNARKSKADAAATLTDASIDLVVALKTRISEVEAELMASRQERERILCELQNARHEIELLKAKLVEASRRISMLEQENAQLRAEIALRNGAAYGRKEEKEVDSGCH